MEGDATSLSFAFSGIFAFGIAYTYLEHKTLSPLKVILTLTLALFISFLTNGVFPAVPFVLIGFFQGYLTRNVRMYEAP
jgi:hypothetical protein